MRARQAALFWLVVLGGAALPAACPPAAARADGGATYVLDPKAVLQGSSYLETDLPADWTGMVVNSFVGANRFYASGITGQETTTANIEAGLIWGGATGHQTLTQVTNYYADTTDGALGAIDRHATWVGMIIGGQNVPGNPKDWQTGIAPGTNLCSGAIATAWSGTAYGSGFTSSADPTFSITTATMLNAYNHYFGTADVINSSWGFTDPSGTNAWTVALDGLAAANPGTTFVAAVGNNGSGTNRVGAPASGYNSISVGGLGNANNYDTISSTSSGGPQDYKDTTQTVHNVRAAVDLVAPGQDLLTAYYGGQTGGNGTTLSGSAAGPSGNNYYQPVAGTSFAAPIVAGGAALLDSASHVNALPSQSRDARVVRAVLMNSADKIAGWDNGQQSVSGVITTTQSLDWNLGAGRLNLSRAYDQYLSGTTGVPGQAGGTIAPVGWDLGLLGGVGAYNDYVFNSALAGGSTLDVTLDWFRDRALNMSTLTASDSGFANLDLQVWDATFSHLIATSDSLYNDAEELHFQLPDDGQYGLRVTYTSQVFGTPVAEDYGLAWSATAVPEPGTLALLSLAVLGLLVRWACRRAPRWPL